jgi:hypothetical protein
MGARQIVCALASVLVAASAPAAVAQPAAAPAPAVAPAPALAPVAAMVTGIVTSGQVVAAAVPLNSGAWGTDYITVSHTLSVGARYAVIRDGLPYTETRPVAACSNQYHGIDVLILRAATHPKSATVEWGDPARLAAGDELFMPPRREIHIEMSRLKFVHVNLIEWSNLRRADLEPQWHHVMVGEGYSKPGFSGSPWVRDGKVYGLHKGSVRLRNNHATYPVAETAARVAECLKALGYEHLVPRE